MQHHCCPPSKDWKKLTIIMVRHAESKNNCIFDIITSQFGGNVSQETLAEETFKLREADCTISERGSQQAEVLGLHVFNGGLKVNNLTNWTVVTSPFKRCLLTCKAITDKVLFKKIIVNPLLYEIFGCFDTNTDGSTIGRVGYTAQDIQTTFGFTCETGMENGWYQLPVKESHEEFDMRVEKIVEWLWEKVEESQEDTNTDLRNTDNGLLMVIHGMLMSAVISSLTKACNGLVVHNNTGYTSLELFSTDKYFSTKTNSYEKKRIVGIKYINRIDHLLSNPNLITGDRVFDDNWMQEFLV
jgi:broad specificity phosphatase PhoE